MINNSEKLDDETISTDNINKPMDKSLDRFNDDDSDEDEL